MKTHTLYMVAGVLAILILGGNSWIVRSGERCPDPGACQCVVTIAKSGLTAKGNTDPSCSVKVNLVPGSTSRLTDCALVEPGSFNRIVMCDVGVKATLRCQTLTTTVGPGTAKIFSCSENGANQPQVTGSHYDGWTNNVGGRNTNASSRPGRLLTAVRRKLFADDAPDAAVIATETEAMVISNGDGGFGVDRYDNPRVTLTEGQATVTSFCDGYTAVLNGPAVINITNDSASLNALLDVFNGRQPDFTERKCNLEDISGKWRGVYTYRNARREDESMPIVITLQGSEGTITTPTDSQAMTDFWFSGSNFSVEAKSRSGPGSLSLEGRVSKGQMTFTGGGRVATAAGSLSLFGSGIAERLIIHQFALPKAAVNTPYSAQLYVSSPTGSPVTWSIVSGSLPSGMSLDGSLGKISGTATSTGDFKFTAQVTDSSGDTFQQPLTLTVSNLTLAANILPAAYHGQTFKYKLQVIGGTPPYTFSSDFQLPFAYPGLPQISATGELILEPDSNQRGGVQLMFQVKDSKGLSEAMIVEIMVRGLTLTGSQFLPNARVGAPYSYTFPATGGSGSVTWTTNAELDGSGLQFDSSTGTLSGIPQLSGSFFFSVTAADTSASDSRSFNLNVDAAPALALGSRQCKSCGAKTKNRIP